MTNIDHDALARRIVCRLSIQGYFRVPKYGGAEFAERHERAQELAIKSVVRELREALPTSEPRETGWLIERNREHGPEWAVFGAFGVEWTKDSNKACRFARREDAEQLAYGEDCDAITEHKWS